MVIDEEVAVPLPILDYDGTLRIVPIPHLDEAGFDFLIDQLGAYKAAIVQEAKHPPESG